MDNIAILLQRFSNNKPFSSIHFHCLKPRPLKISLWHSRCSLTAAYKLRRLFYMGAKPQPFSHKNLKFLFITLRQLKNTEWFKGHSAVLNKIVNSISLLSANSWYTILSFSRLSPCWQVGKSSTTLIQSLDWSFFTTTDFSDGRGLSLIQLCWHFACCLLGLYFEASALEQPLPKR